MKISEIYAMEESNKSFIYLHLEGMFYKAYEKSAFRFCKRFRECKVSSVHSVSLACDIVRIGFPKGAMGKYGNMAKSLGYCVENRGDKLMVISGVEPIDGFVNWKHGCVGANNLQKEQEPTMDLFETTPKYAVDHMDNVQKLRLYREAYDNAVAIANFTSRLHRNFRFGAGDSLRNESLALAVKLHVAFCRNEPINERDIYYDIEQIRIRTRIMHDVKQFDTGVWKMLNDRFDRMQKILRPESCAFSARE